jgi:hypothetical protein
MSAVHFPRPRKAHTSPNITSIEKRERGGGSLVGAERRHQDKATEGEEGDVKPNLPLKHPNETLTTYI